MQRPGWLNALAVVLAGGHAHSHWARSTLGTQHFAA